MDEIADAEATVERAGLVTRHIYGSTKVQQTNRLQGAAAIGAVLAVVLEHSHLSLQILGDRVEADPSLDQRLWVVRTRWKRGHDATSRRTRMSRVMLRQCVPFV
jgi:hypothetical protein